MRNDSQNLISVIVPVYNVEVYLRDCIDSILSQTYSEFELILVDDGSKDHSGKICEEYAQKDSRIQVIHKKNGGLSSARNAGIDRAKGNFIAFVDSDDIVHKEYLERMFRAAVDEEADIVLCHFIKGIDCKWEDILEERRESRVGNQIMDKFNDDNVTVTVAWNKLYKTELFLKTGLRYPEGKIHEDMFLTPQLLAISKKIVILSDKLYFYRERPDSIMTKRFSDKKLQVLEAIRFRIDFFESIEKKTLVWREYEGYIRKTAELYSEMKKYDEKYKIEMKIIYEKLIKDCFRPVVFKNLSFKYKIKLIKFAILKRG